MKLKIQYFAQLKESRGCSEEELETSALTIKELYSELKEKYNFNLDYHDLKVARSDQFCSWNTSLKDGDLITFLPPVGGG